MKIEVLIRLEGDYDVEGHYTPDLWIVRREESLSFPPNAENDPETVLSSMTETVQETIESAVQTAYRKVALMGDHLKENLG